MGRREALAAQVRGLATGTPYVVQETERGFDVRVDLEDPRWHGLVSAAGLSAVLVHHVEVDEAGSYVLVDERRDLTWRPGLGVDGGPAPTMDPEGRVLHRRRPTASDHGWGDRLRFGTPVRFSLHPDEARALVRTAAGALGMRERRPDEAPRPHVPLLVTLLGGLAVLVVLVLLLVARA